MLFIILTVLVAAIHFYFLYLEMTQWEAPRTRKVFNTTAEFASASTAMAANQGAYNGVIAAALLVGLSLGGTALSLVAFLLLGIIALGLFAALTVTRSAIYFQSIPAAIALLAYAIS